MGKAAILTSALVTGYALVSPLFFLTSGIASAQAAALAAGVCAFAGVCALTSAELAERLLTGANAMHTMLLGMFARMGIPLIVLLVMTVKENPLLADGFAYYLIGFYLLMLFVEVTLIMPRMPKQACAGNG